MNSGIINFPISLNKFALNCGYLQVDAEFNDNTMSPEFLKY